MDDLSLSSSRLSLAFQQADSRLTLARYALDGHSWLHEGSASGLFAVTASGARFDAGNLALRDARIERRQGMTALIAEFASPEIAVTHHVSVYADTGLIEQWQLITARQPCSLTRVDSFSLNVPRADYDLLRFSSDWGREFEPLRAPLTGEVILETRAGRSSKGMHPWAALIGQAGALSMSVMWSGNWALRFEPLADGGARLSGGLHDWQFEKMLAPGQSMESPPVVLALGADLNDIARQHTRVGRRFWFPRNTLSDSLPVEWNHWWSYEDTDIDETVFERNSAAAASLGIDLVTLDAGWFGPSDAETHWHSYRGDWSLINRARFPHGIRALADAAHKRELCFGLWCEIEGLGEQSALNRQQPDFAALRAGLPLGYVCLGNPDAQAWAYETLARLIRDNAADWIKLDFNLDPGAGCNRVDHGHGAGDGLYEHVQGYYRLLDRIRADFPGVVLENCASGGQRLDLGMMRHTHLTFLSDADWPVHSLQVFWGASLMLAPETCLRWSFSEWRPGNGPPQQNFDPRDPALTPEKLAYYTRIAMLSACGFSQKLPDLPLWATDEIARQIRTYQTQMRRFVREAELYRLTDQPRRDGSGERWCAFQYRLPDEHLLAVFRLPGADAGRSIRLSDLDPTRLYQLDDFDGGLRAAMLGRELMETGITFSELREEQSALIRLF